MRITRILVNIIFALIIILFIFSFMNFSIINGSDSPWGFSSVRTNFAFIHVLVIRYILVMAASLFLGNFIKKELCNKVPRLTAFLLFIFASSVSILYILVYSDYIFLKTGVLSPILSNNIVIRIQHTPILLFSSFAILGFAMIPFIYSSRN